MIQSVKNHPQPVALSIMRGVQFVLPFRLKVKATGVPIDLSGKTVVLRIYKIDAGVETEVLEVNASVSSPTNGEGVFTLSSAVTESLDYGEEQWYKATIENGASVEHCISWGAVNMKDAKP